MNWNNPSIEDDRDDEDEDGDGDVSVIGDELAKADYDGYDEDEDGGGDVVEIRGVLANRVRTRCTGRARTGLEAC